MTTPRHSFYETEDRLTLEIFDKGVDPAAASIVFEPRSFTYKNGDKELSLAPLRGQINVEGSSFTIGKVKVEVRFAKAAPGRWGQLVGDAPDPLASFASTSTAALPEVSQVKKPRKNWDGITKNILEADKPVTSDEDPNAGGDAVVNDFFQKLYADADEDTRRAMMKSFSESGGTTLSTNWDEVKKAPVEVKPPEGSEWKKWAA